MNVDRYLILEADDPCNGTGWVKCWNPGGPCTDAGPCEWCGPCRQHDDEAVADGR